mgnify:CR=1 FL=1
MAATFASDALDPLVRQVGEVAGLLRSGPNDSVEVNEDFFKDPVTELGKAISARQDEVIELLGQIMCQTGGEVLGLPAAREAASVLACHQRTTEGGCIWWIPPSGGPWASPGAWAF